jgi:hypothetical protein
MRPCNASYVLAAKHYSARRFLLVKVANWYIFFKKIISGRPWLEIRGKVPVSLKFAMVFSVSPGKLGTLRYITLPMVLSTSTVICCQLIVPQFRSVQSETLRMSPNKPSNNTVLSKPRILTWSISLRFPITNFLRISFFFLSFSVGPGG